MKACTNHQYVTDIQGRAISRRCVYCGEDRMMSRVKSVIGLKPSTPAPTPAQLANAAEWAELNARQPVTVK